LSYKHLRKFLIDGMNPDKSNGVEKNYQPVVIKFLNQSEDGFATKEEIQLELQRANPDRELPSGVLKTVTDTLIRNNIIKPKDNGFVLIGHKNFNPAHKAEITKRSDDRIEGTSKKTYVVLDNETELANAQKLFLENLRKHTTKQDRIIMSFPGPAKNEEDKVDYIQKANLWWYSKNLPDHSIPRFYNCFGYGEPNWGKSNNIDLEINPPMKEATRRVNGAFVKDEMGNIFICHAGWLGGAKSQVGFDEVYPHTEKWIHVDDERDDFRKLILISDITSPNLPENLADYVKLVAKFKAGELTSQKVPYYLLLRHKSEGNPYEDDPSGRVYHFPHNANSTKVIPHSKAVWYDRNNGTRYFWGFGTVARRITRPDGNFEAIFDDFTLFDKESESIEKHGKFLKKATPKIEKMIINRPGFNVQHSISEIDKKIFDEIVGSVKITSNSESNYWMIRPGSNGEDWPRQQENEIAAIAFCDPGPLTQFYGDKGNLDEENKLKLREAIGDSKLTEGFEGRSKEGKINQALSQFNYFMRIKLGDKILAMDGFNKILGAGTVTGKYSHNPSTEFCHTCPVKWDDFEGKTITNAKPWQGTIKPITQQEYEMIMADETSLEDYDEYSNILERKKQLIFYGPPGTGKTFNAVLLANQFTENNSVTTQKMTFKAAAIKILKKEGKPMHYTEITKQILDQKLVETAGETPEATLASEISKEIRKKGPHAVFVKIDKGTYEINPDIEDYEIELGETSDLKSSFIRAVTFHQSYSYEDFIEGIRPHTVNNQISYELEDGIFKLISEDAKADPQNKYVLLIDEINRGNISKIFGELITLIEKDKRETHTLQLAYSKEDFSVPSNLFIIGTMNTADRSLVQIDTALRRRFGFYELMPLPELLTQTVDGVSLKDLLTTLNQRISQQGLREKQIGHSYLMNVNSLDDLHFVFTHEIIPLLQDYFFDDYKKLENDILSTDFIDSENMTIKQDWQKDPERFLEILKKTFPQ